MSIAPPNLPQHSAEKRRVALNSMLVASAMTALKLAAGVFSGSLGVLSDAAHSGLDLAGAALTFLSVRVSDKPADEDHTYGHGKVENISSFVEAGLMGISCAWIIWEALSRMINHTVELHHSIWPVLVLLTSIAVDYWRSRELRAVARRTGSPALATDAFHFASDIWSTLAVLVGLGASWAGTHYGVEWLRYADPFAAIVVSLMILRLTLQLTRETVGALTDQIETETRTRVVSAVKAVDGVLAVEQARVRRSGAAYFADLTLALPRRSTFDRVRAVAARNNVSVHELSVQSHNGRLRVEQHVELDENMPLLEAHNFVSAMEAEILRDAPEIHSVLTHIESEPATIEQPQEIVVEDRRLEMALRAAAVQIPEIVDVHELTVLRAGDHIDVTCHCTLPDQLSMLRVHEVITALEDRFKAECPEVSRVTIHPEPVTDNLR